MPLFGLAVHHPDNPGDQGRGSVGTKFQYGLLKRGPVLFVGRNVIDYEIKNAYRGGKPEQRRKTNRSDQTLS